MNAKKKIILDCDPGMDDSMAIIMAAKSEKIELMAVTTVCGNYPVDITCLNACKTLEMIGRTDVPVARGLAKPLLKNLPNDPFTHGEDGQANAFLPKPEMTVSDNAVDLIIDLVKHNPGDITIVSTAPMSNIALAMIKNPEIKKMIPEIIAISGSFGLNQYAFLNATGDTPQSEWNVFVDPDAAKIVYESGVHLTAIGLDIATHFDVDFSNQDLTLLKNCVKKEAFFLLNAINFVHEKGYEAYCTVIDCMAVAFAIDATLIKTMEAHVGIETKEGLTLGMTIMDRRHHHAWNKLPIVHVGYEADYSRFLRMIKQLILK